jgi:hypothetical protein
VAGSCGHSNEAARSIKRMKNSNLLTVFQFSKNGFFIGVKPAYTVCSDENFREKFKSENFLENFPDMVSLFTFYTVIIMLIYTSPFILIGR